METSFSYSENLRRAIEGLSPAWIPFTLDIGALSGLTDPILGKFREVTNSEKPDEYFGYDFRTASLSAHFGGEDPALHHDDAPPETSFDEWGVGHWAGGATGTYEKMFSPLSLAIDVEEIKSYPSPIIEDSTLAATIENYKRRGYPVFGYAGSVYEWSWWLRGMERFMEDLILHPHIADTITQRVASYVKNLAIASARAGIDVLCFYDDVGMQTGMQISPALWRHFIKPHWNDILNAVRSAYPRSIFFLHSCGNIGEILPDIVELGFHILHPVQPECMEFTEVRKEYGKDIVLCATVSAQKIFPFSKPEGIRHEIRCLKEICADDNRCILTPSNMVQPETPWENILAFVEEAQRGRPVL
jgi:uroporphyrinogen decarboxylase